jgi:anaerobic ribonucleoside-triphosphate reductase activating protein
MGRHCEGISVSGGEPLEQAPALLAFLRNIRERTSLSIVLFSGYTLEEMHDIPHGPEIVSHLDVLIAGRFIREQRLGRGLLGSANQRILVLTDRYCLSDLQGTPTAEVTIDAQGTILLSGIDPPCLPSREEWR